MAEINARALMFNLGREDAIDSTTSAKIARYAERTVTYCAHEWFGPAPARVSLQVIASGECPAACRTFMTANVAVQMLAQI